MRYDSYKDSGVDWLGEVPEHWEIKKLKHILNFQTGGTPSSGHTLFYDGDLPWVTISDLNGRYTNQTHFISKYGQRSANIPLTPKGSLLYSFKLSVGQVAFAHQDLYTNEAIASFLPTNNNNLNYYFYMLPIFIAKNANKNIYGADILNQELIKNSYILSIPEAEQTAIAQYLDDKTAKIDCAIALEQQQIELLKERKQIVIQTAVTRGLNPDVALKDSGVEWLGEVPEHWVVSRLKNLCELFGRIGFRGYNASDLVDEISGAITVSPSNIIESNMDFSNCSYLSWEKYYESPEIMLKNDDIILVKTGSTFGKVGYISNLPKEATINPQLLIIRNINLITKYFYLFLISKAFQSQIKENVIGSTIPTISESRILNMKICVPPLSEQTAIAHYLDEQTTKIDHAISIKLAQIDKLKEYKTVLINEVVTGKRRVVQN